MHPKRQVERVPRLIPGARAEIIADTGHGPQIDHAGEVNRRVLRFMASIEMESVEMESVEREPWS